MYSTKNVYKELKVLPIKKFVFKNNCYISKNHNLLQPILHVINTRHAKQQFSHKKI